MSSREEILARYENYKRTGRDDYVSAQDVEQERAESEYTRTQYRAQETGSRVDEIERELYEHSNNLRNTGKITEAELMQDLRYRQLLHEYEEAKAEQSQRNYDVNLAERRVTGDLGNRADSYFSGGISASESPFDKKQSSIPITAPAMSPTERAYKTGNAGTMIDPSFSLEDIYQRQHETRLANYEQQMYVAQIRAGGIGLAEALLKPKTQQSYFVNGKKVSKDKTSINLETFLTERGYDITKPETIPNSVFKAKKQTTARNRASSSGTMGDLNTVANSYPQTSQKEFEERQKIKSTFNKEITQLQKLKKIVNDSKIISATQNFSEPVMATGSLSYIYGSKNKEEMPYIPLGQFAQGISNTFGSYYNMGENVVRFAQGKEEKRLLEHRTPIQDSFFGVITKSFDDTFTYGISLDATFKQNFDRFYSKQAQRDPYMVAGEIVSEALIWAIPISPAIQGARYLIKTIPKITGIGDILVRSALEASASASAKTRTDKLLASDPNLKFRQTFQNTNMFRKQIDKDIFALDNANQFTSSKVNLGYGSAKSSPTNKPKIKKTVEPDPYYSPKLPTDKQGRQIAIDEIFKYDTQNIGYNAFLGESKSVGKKFQGTRINLGEGTSRVYDKKSGGGFSDPPNTRPYSGTPTSRKKPSPSNDKDNNFIRTNNGLILQLRDPKTVVRQINKQQTKTIPKQKKKKRQSLQYVYDLEVIRYPAQTRPLPQALQPSIRQQSAQNQRLSLTPIIKPQQSFAQLFKPQARTTVKEQPVARQTLFGNFVNPQVPRFAFTPINPTKTIPSLGFPFPPPTAQSRRKRKSKTRKVKLDNLEWKVPDEFLVGFTSKDISKTQIQFWGEKDQLGKGYKRRRK